MYTGCLIVIDFCQSDRAVLISYETNVTFPSSPQVEICTVMGVVIVVKYLKIGIAFVFI